MMVESAKEISSREAIINRAKELLAKSKPIQVREAIKGIVSKNEDWRGRKCINLLAPEALISPTARRLLSSEVCQRAGEGDIGNRWFAGLKHVDELEALTVELTKKLFHCKYADQRLVAGMVSNMVVYFALTEPGDIIMSIPKPMGGHSSDRLDGPPGVRGLKVVDIPFDSKEMTVDMDQFRKLVYLVRPRLIALGSTLALFPYPLKEMREIGSELGYRIYLDGAHQLGLIANEKFQNVLGEGADVLTGSTGKTLSGPQGGLILWNDDALTERLRWAIFPGLAATHQINRVAALAVSLAEMLEFGKAYAAQIVANAKALAKALDESGFEVLCAHKGYTETQQVAANVKRFGGGYQVAEVLSEANIITNKNLLPGDSPEDWDRPSGLRLGTTEITRLGMKEKEMEIIAGFFVRVLMEKEEPSKVARDVIDFRRGFQKVQYCFDIEG